jgi:hypothetical protein
VEFHHPDEGVGALDSQAEKNVMKWCLGDRQTAELTGGLRRIVVLEMGYSFFKRWRTVGRHLVTEGGDLGCSEHALHWVDEDPLPLKSVEESP